jgi:23S rRNA m2A2503 methyltransferase
MKWNVWGHPLKETEQFFQEGGFPRFRAKQLHDYLYKRYVYDFAQMTQFPAAMRDWLAENAVIEKPEVVRQQHSSNGDTIKLLLRLSDGSLIETVCMKHDYGNSICVSTQVGCAMGCIFCASTRKGMERNLTPGEMLAQIYAFRILYQIPVHSIVLMGSGEPLQNYENVLQFMHLCHAPDGLNLSYRGMTLSTCGIVPAIYQLADEKIPITLAISLHAPNDEIRNRILPSSRKYPIQTLIDAARHYFNVTGRRVTFEYILIKGINAERTHAEELCRLVGDMSCHFNLIPINGTEHIQLYPPDHQAIERFSQILEKHGKSVTVRRQMGDEIQAACGQLKRRYLKDNS